MYKQIFNNTFNTIFEKKKILIKALSLYLFFHILASYFQINNIIYIEGKEEIQNYFIHFGTSFILYIVVLFVAITTHRIFILEEHSIPTWGYFRFTKREWSFIVSSIGIGIIAIIIVFAFIFAGTIFGKSGTLVGIGLSMIAITIIFSRLSLVFPSISIDKDISLGEAWNFTKEYKLLVYLSVIIFPVFFSILLGVVYGLVIKFLVSFVYSELTILYSLLEIFIAVFTISALSATYKYILEEHPEYFEIKSEIKVQLREYTIENTDDICKVTIPNVNDINFEYLKNKLKVQYFEIGYTNISLDKENSWMIKSGNSYILLSKINDEYKIETFKVEGPNFLDLLDLKDKNNDI
ncbi:MAG TPA: hypothetical protein EYG97_00260 [Arcobacter sp.]|nr:hypothetical protein [Arcobacter sp.]HIP55441.1 hypothetical protein [Arcobacter sp.]